MKKTMIRILSCLLTVVMIAATLTFTVSADTNVKAYSGNGHDAIQGKTVAQRVNVNGEFTGFGIAMPTWTTVGSTCTMGIFTWNKSVDETMKAEPLASRFVECKDNATNWVEFDPLPAGEYLFAIYNITGQVGAWCCKDNAVTKGFMYQDGGENKKEIEMTIRFVEKPDEPFLPCQESQIFTGDRKAPDEYVIPADSRIYTHEVMPDTWVFTDALGRTSLTNADVGDPKDDKTLAMFYWTWHCTQGSDTVDPLNIQKFLEEHPDAINDYDNPAWPNAGANFWNEPIYGYYRGYDEWVIRRQGELLTNAGVDVIFTDNTNGTFTWKSAYDVVFETWTKAMNDGMKTPKVSFMLPFSPSSDACTQLRMLYKDIFYEEKYHPLWFYWDGKPMLMAWQGGLNKTDLQDKEIANYFTFRNNEPGYINSASATSSNYGHWGWLSMYPQAYYYANRSDNKNKIVEQITVGVAMNHDYVKHQLAPMNGEHIAGRSYTSDLSHINEPDAKLYGYNFAEQFDYALQIDPKVVFVTGWNEWIAGRYDEWQGIENGLPDECNDEFSRDIEPTKGDLADNYYYELVNYVRKFKGVRPIPAPTPAGTIDMTAGAAQWNDFGPYYAAYTGNTGDRDCKGYGTNYYTEHSGRNDIAGARVARDNEYVWFYVECMDDITPYTDNLWMNLYIDCDQNNQGWNTFDFVINKSAASEKTVVLEKFKDNSYASEKVADCEYVVDGKTMTVKVPKSALGLSGYDFTINFAWTDNVHDEADHGTETNGKWVYTTFSGDIMDFYVSGDVAPGQRFKYSYVSTTENAQITTPSVETEAPTEALTEAPTDAPATDAPATNPVTEPADEGCKSVLGGASVTVLSLIALLGCAWKRRN